MPFIKMYKRSWQTDETVLRIHVMPTLGCLALDEITVEHISDLINVMRQKSYTIGTINRVVVIVRYVLNLACKWSILGIVSNPASGLSTGPDIQRSRFLDRQEIDRLIAAILADENRIAAQAILLLLFTGARRNEITQVKWEYVDFDNRTLLVPLSKSGKPRLIFLNSHALAVLRRVPTQRYTHLAPGTLIDATEAVARAVPFDLESLALWGDGELK